MNRKLYITGICTALLNLPIQGAWMLVDDFEEGPATPKFTYNVALGAHDDPEFNYAADPAGGPGTVFWCDPVTYGTSWTNVYANWVLPEPIAEGTTGTLFFRYYAEAENSNGIIVGLTDIPLTINSETGIQQTPNTWNDFEVGIGIFGLPFTPRDGGAYVETEGAIGWNVWWKVWCVVDNANDETTFYIQGPDDAEPKHIPIPDGAGGTFESALFQWGTTDALVGFMYGQNAGNPAAPQTGIPTWLDDIYVDPTGINLTDPISTSSGDDTWGGYDVVDGFVDTGDWLGWLYIPDLQSDWVYSYKLETWTYFPDPGSSGGWSYILR